VPRRITDGPCMQEICRMTKQKFPTLAVILLVAGIVWAFNSFGYIDFNFPWLPVILIIVSIGMIANRYRK